jgi:uncharacterized membrane protein
MRLKKMVRLSEDELAAIYAALAVNVRGYHQVVEVSLSPTTLRIREMADDSS